MTSKIESIEWPNCLLSNLKRNYAETIYDQEYLYIYIYLFNKAKKIYIFHCDWKEKNRLFSKTLFYLYWNYPVNKQFNL